MQEKLLGGHEQLNEWLVAVRSRTAQFSLPGRAGRRLGACPTAAADFRASCMLGAQHVRNLRFLLTYTPDRSNLSYLLTVKTLAVGDLGGAWAASRCSA